MYTGEFRLCPVEHYRCPANGLCIGLDWVCDGENDCLDGTDEMNCCKLSLKFMYITGNVPYNCAI